MMHVVCTLKGHLCRTGMKVVLYLYTGACLIYLRDLYGLEIEYNNKNKNNQDIYKLYFRSTYFSDFFK